MRAWILLALLLSAPAAMAHGAPPPRAEETRLMHDHNDDCGGDGVTSNCRGSIDLITLEVQERWNGQDQLSFRFLLDKGQSGSHKVTLQFDAPGGRKSFDLTTTNQNTFGGTFDSAQAASANDGTRYTVDATLSYAKAGLQAGDKIGKYRVEASRDGTLGDFMPGGYQGPLGPVNDPPQGDGATNTMRPDYTLRGPTYYVALDGPTPRGNDRVAFTVRNLLDTPQGVTLTLASPEGAFAWAGGGAQTTLDLPRKGVHEVEATWNGGGRTGTLSATATTDLGGRTVKDGSYDMGAAPTASSTSTAPASTTTSKPAPLGLAPLALAVLAAAGRRK